MRDRIGRAQCGQDNWVLKKLGNKRNGYFLEAGAYDGVKNSNTYRLEKEYGWNGICVEPSRAYAALVRNRNCICENICIYCSEGVVKFLDRSGRHVGKQSSVIYDDESTSDVIDRVSNNLHWLVDVPATTLGHLLQKHNAPSIIDYFSLDVEGSEYQILRCIDFNAYTFLTLTIEHNVWGRADDGPIQIKNRQNIYELLTSRNYIRQNEKAPNEDWYCHESVK